MFIFKNIFKSLFILREREVAQAGDRQREKEGERERERIPRRLHTGNVEPQVALEPTNCEIMT